MKKEIDFVNTLSFVLLASSLMSILGFILMYMDKRRAKKNHWRIKESNKQWIYVFAWYPFEYFLNATKQTAKDIVRRKPKQ